MTPRLYIVAYDIRCSKRWRKVFRYMQGMGEWLQLSVFQCRLTDVQRAELQEVLEEIVNQKADHVIIIDVAPADKVEPRVTSIGKAYEAVTHGPTIV